MRAGKLDRIITLARPTTTVDDFGTPASSWDQYAEVRAELIEAATTELLNRSGSNSEAVVVFRIRYLDGLSMTDRVGYSGQAFAIREIKEIGRRRGFELRCVATGPLS